MFLEAWLLFPEKTKMEDEMKGKEITISVIALLGFFVFLVVGPACAKDEVQSSKAKASVTEAADTAEAKAKKAEQEFTEASTLKKININKADVESLTHLKGIGPETAQNIINYRKQIGSFQKLEDLMKVKGIGEKTFDQIKSHISLN